MFTIYKKKTCTCIVLDIATVQTRRIYPNHIKEDAKKLIWLEN